MLPFGFLFSDCTHPHTFPYLLSLSATSSFSLPTLLPYISLHVWLSVYCDITILFPVLISHLLEHKPFLSSILTYPQSATYLPYFFHLFYYSYYFFVLALSSINFISSPSTTISIKLLIYFFFINFDFYYHFPSSNIASCSTHLSFLSSFLVYVSN